MKHLPKNTIPINHTFSDWAYRLWVAGGSNSNHLSNVVIELDKIIHEIEYLYAQNECDCTKYEIDE